MDTSLNPFKAHIVPLMSSYVNVKAINLITLLVLFKYKIEKQVPGTLPNLYGGWLLFIVVSWSDAFYCTRKR